MPTDEYELIMPENRNVLLGYLQLMRLPNIFTAMADVAMGFLFVTATVTPSDGRILALLMAASILLYAGGVVLNDVLDRELDTVERPNRPLPSGRVTLNGAVTFCMILLLSGTALGWTAALLTKQILPGVMASLLLGCILIYNLILKTTPLGPLAMGACRLLNVFLGMSVIEGKFSVEHWLVAGGIGLYIAGVTWFARTEAERSRRLSLSLASAVMMLGIGMIAWMPNELAIDRLLPNYRVGLRDWYLLMLLLVLMIFWRCVVAIIKPDPRWVQSAVGLAVLSLILLDAAICLACNHAYSAAAIFLLMLPVRYLGRKISPT